MKRIFISICIALCFIAAHAEKYYEITGDNVNVRSTPVNGEVVGHLNSDNMVMARSPENGWLFVYWPDTDIRGYISEKFVKEIQPKDFSKRMLGDYMGEMKGDDWSYCLASLREKDGYLLLTLTDYTDDQGGFRGHMTHVYSGLPTEDGLSFSHYLYPYDDDRSLAEQMKEQDPLDIPYKFVIMEGNKIRSVDRVLELQESYGVSDPKVSERNQFHLAGKVKKFAYARAYSRDFVAGMEDDEYGHPFVNTSYVVVFSPDGDVLETAQFDNSGKVMTANCKFNYSNNGKVTVEGKIWDGAFSAEYERKITPFYIRYDGQFSGKDSGGLIGGYVELGLNGYPLDARNELYTPPFIHDTEDSSSYHYHTNGNPLVPVGADMYYIYGPDGFRFENVVFKDITVDNQGNWTKRKAYIDGQPAYAEIRNIEYY